jgi:hypothetical protein
MSSFFCIWPNWFGTGFTNQVFFIISAILKAHKSKIPLVIFERFRVQPLTENFVPLKDVVDLNHLNEIIAPYNVCVLDKYGTNLSLVAAKYGTTDIKINITEEIRDAYLENNRLFIPKDVYLNDIKGDPVFGQPKKLFLTYKINEFVFTEIYDEHNRSDISIDITFFHQFHGWGQVDIPTYDEDLFKKLIKAIKFTNIFNNISDHCLLIDKNDKYVLNNLHNNEKMLNVIHLRLENDWIPNLSQINNMTEKDYLAFLEDKYIDVINKHFSKNSNILVLTYDRNNRVVKYLQDNNYDFYTTKKNIFDGREPHAVIDLLVGEKCNGCFIGNWNRDNNLGSTFSYMLDQRIDPSVKRVLIDAHKIKTDELVIV